MRNVKIKHSISFLGTDIVICVQNENGHIGSVVSAEPYQKNGKLHATLNTWNRLTHKDDMVAAMYAKKLSIAFHCVVTCICGIHLEDIKQEEIQAVLDLVEEDIQMVIEEIEVQRKA